MGWDRGAQFKSLLSTECLFGGVPPRDTACRRLRGVSEERYQSKEQPPGKPGRQVSVSGPRWCQCSLSEQACFLFAPHPLALSWHGRLFAFSKCITQCSGGQHRIRPGMELPRMGNILTARKATLDVNLLSGPLFSPAVFCLFGLLGPSDRVLSP